MTPDDIINTPLEVGTDGTSVLLHCAPGQVLKLTPSAAEITGEQLILFGYELAGRKP